MGLFMFAVIVAIGLSPLIHYKLELWMQERTRERAIAEQQAEARRKYAQREAAMPKETCPHCNGAGAAVGCTPCSGRGWRYVDGMEPPKAPA